MKLYDEKNKQLIYINKEATSSYWDAQWEKLAKSTKYQKKLPRVNTAIILTKKYLSKNSKVLEGGCGLAMTSWYLHLLGYETIALDYAENTIEFLKKNIPEVNPINGDVRKTNFKDNSIDGYWSFGVIEHFWDGYDDIVNEAHRIIRNDGYFFVTFPQMSIVRKLKAKMGLYKLYSFEEGHEGFYQFALNPTSVIKNIESKGFKLEQSISLGGMKGLKDEVSFLKPLFQKIYNSRNKFAIIIRKLIDICFSCISGHSHVVVFKKVTK